MVRYGATDGFVGRGLSGAIANNMFKISPCVVKTLSKEYLYYSLKQESLYNDLINKVGASAMPAVNFGMVSKLKITIPHLPEQLRIAEILSSNYALITKTDVLIEKTKEVKQGLMQELLTKGIGHTEFKDSELGRIPKDWEVKTIGDLVKLEGGSQPERKYFQFEKKTGYIRLIQIRDYKSDRFITYIPIEPTKKFCKKDDTMIGRYGPPIFQILRGLEGAYNVALIKAIPNKHVTNEYLYYFLKQERLFNLIESLSQRTSGQTGIDIDALKGYCFPLPTVFEQQRITEILINADEKLEALTKRKQQLEKIKQGLMQDLLTGRVRVKV